jgi:protein-S-isoprenylcysteine O-methyltransferase Ste14
MAKNSQTLIKYYVRIIAYLVFFSVSLFFSAGRIDWTMGWVYIAINAISMIANSLILLLLHPGLMTERVKGVDRKNKKDWDRPLAGIMTFFGPIIICVVSGFNLRMLWLPRLPFWLQVTGIVLAIIGCMISAWAIASNRFFYGFMRIAKEAGHSVSNHGAYRIVRHPGYLGAILVNLATPLILNSLWAFIPATITIVAVIIRTSLEDKTLLRALEGYLDYSKKVPFRLMPLIW